MTDRQQALIRFALQYCDAFQNTGDPPAVAAALDDECHPPAKKNEFAGCLKEFNRQLMEIGILQRQNKEYKDALTRKNR